MILYHNGGSIHVFKPLFIVGSIKLVPALSSTVFSLYVENCIDVLFTSELIKLEIYVFLLF